MKTHPLYSSPLRVYLGLGFLALIGIYCGLQLPVSLFPNSSKPTVHVSIGYGGATAEEFLNSYGRELENQLHNLSSSNLEVDRVVANYNAGSVSYEVEFKWGTVPREAKTEVLNIANAMSSRFPKEMRDSLNVSMWNGNSGFLAVSFYSPSRSLDDLYQVLEPLLAPKLSAIRDAERAGLFNPSEKEIRIELNPEKMAAFQIYPRDVQAAVSAVVNGSRGGSVQVGLNRLDVTMNRLANSMEDLGRTLIPTPKGSPIHLSDISQLDYGVSMTHSELFKTSGALSLILFARPRSGGNVKRMSEDILEVVHKTELSFPKDVQYKVLVDPSEFISAAVNNVLHEVFLAALLAVLVLFLFIGNLRNVITAAIEIPMSIILAFILMRFAGINLNLISLGGLALSAGMNVDASVVVMENIFRHFEKAPSKMNVSQRLQLIILAVSEVRFPIMASTIASLVVFLPLAFTSGLSHALLSDLALAVVFSHGFSALVALVLVPTVRLHLMSNTESQHSESAIEPFLKKMEETYGRSLCQFLMNSRLKHMAYGGIIFLLVVLSVLVLPRLPKEVVGRPDTDWLLVIPNTDGNTNVRQMASQSEEIEADLMKTFGDRIQYTFTQIQDPNEAVIMARLKNKKDMQPMWTEMQSHFQNTPLVHYEVVPWNPSEFRLPDPPQLRVAIRGGSPKDRVQKARAVYDLLQENKTIFNVRTIPNMSRREAIVLAPRAEQWAMLQGAGVQLHLYDLTEISRVATEGMKLGELAIDNRLIPINMQYPASRVASLEDLGSLPIGVQGKLIPFKALAPLSIQEVDASIHRENEKEVIYIEGKVKQGDEGLASKEVSKSQDLIEKWNSKDQDLKLASLNFENPQQELDDSLKELGKAVVFSILLIFLTMVFQFGDVVSALLVLISVPLGFIGVLLALFVFKSTLSLNSVLGVILLNGIAVANSIILVDFLKRLVEQGYSPGQAAVEAATKRLRPIVMTSLTTGLGMLPVALGFGEGGRILQPLGITVIGGLGFSMSMTLFVVPSLQVSYLEWKKKRMKPPDVLSQARPSELVPIESELSPPSWRSHASPRPPEISQ